MNATELADELMKCSIPRLFYLDELMNNAAIMLRQQQAEIKALKQIIDANNLNQNIGQFVKPTNEPVAWMDEETGCFVYSQYEYEDLDEHGKDGLIPLYTHPVKELTDEEIIKVYEDMLGVASAKGSAIDFARAIMKRCGIISGTDK